MDMRLGARSYQGVAAARRVSVAIRAEGRFKTWLSLVKAANERDYATAKPLASKWTRSTKRNKYRSDIIFSIKFGHLSPYFLACRLCIALADNVGIRFIVVKSNLLLKSQTSNLWYTSHGWV